jgi:hypothetical protein
MVEKEIIIILNHNSTFELMETSKNGFAALNLDNFINSFKTSLKKIMYVKLFSLLLLDVYKNIRS